MKKAKTIEFNFFTYLLIFVIIVAFIAIILKLSYVNTFKIVDGIDLEAFANNRNTTTKTLYATRGTIYDSNGEYLAQTVNSYTVIAYLAESRTTDMNNPQHVVDKELTAEKLSEVFLKHNITSMSKEYILSLLNQENRYQVELGPGGRDITEIIKVEIENLNLPGIDFISSSKRYYQMGDFASYLVGYTLKDDAGKVTGKMGIESYYNQELAGKDGQTSYQTDTYGYKLPNSKEVTDEAVAGANIYLTIDNNIQLFVEQELKDLAENYEMSWATLTVADAKTGAILASGSVPSFDPNKLNITNYLNPLVSYAYEPGSTMKIFSFMAAMEAGIYDGNKTYQSGTIQVDDATIKDFNTVGWGEITFDSGFAYSSNVAATNLALELGRDRLISFYEKCGFGALTNITLPDEVAGDIDVVYKTELATASFGQGITTTPIQNIQALTMLANDGVMLKPYIVERIVDPNTNEVLYEGKKEELGQIVSVATAEKMRSLMYDVVYSGKTDASMFKPDTIGIIGKTGTAQIANPNGGGYLTGTYDYVRSFATLFPADEPQYILYFSVKQFQGPFKEVTQAIADIIDEIAKYKNLVEAVSSDQSKIYLMDNFLNLDTTKSLEKLKNLNLRIITMGDGNVITKQYPNEGSEVISDSLIIFKTNSNNYIMPDLTNFTRSEVVTFCNFIGINYKITGEGLVSATSIPVGSPIDLNTTLEITLTSTN